MRKGEIGTKSVLILILLLMINLVIMPKGSITQSENEKSPPEILCLRGG
jgi:hypothetical protein